MSDEQKIELLQQTVTQLQQTLEAEGEAKKQLLSQNALYVANMKALTGQRDTLIQTELEVRVELEQVRAENESNIAEAKKIIDEKMTDLQEVRTKFGQVKHQQKVAESSNAQLSSDYSALETAISNYLSVQTPAASGELLTVQDILDNYSPDAFENLAEPDLSQEQTAETSEVTIGGNVQVQEEVPAERFDPSIEMPADGEESSDASITELDSDLSRSRKKKKKKTMTETYRKPLSQQVQEQKEKQSEKD